MKKNFNITLYFIFSIVFCIGIYAADIFLSEPAASEPERIEEASYSLIQQEGSVWLFTNKADGYSLSLPLKPEVSLDYAPVCFKLFSENFSLLVYRQENGSLKAAESYVNYSDSFIKDEINFSLESDIMQEINGLPCRIVSYSRYKLSSLPEDQNIYTVYDIQSEDNTVYTLFFKYSGSEFKTVLTGIADSFRLCEISGEYSLKTLPSADSPRMDEAAAKAYSNIFVNTNTLSWGIFDPKSVLPQGGDGEIEKKLDYDFTSKLLYSAILDGIDPAINGIPLFDILERSCPGNIIPELTLQYYERQDGKNKVLCVLNGEYDDFLNKYAQAVAAFKRPVIFRLANEMNGDWCNYNALHLGRDAELYIEFYRYIFGIFQENGAYNVIWVWNPNSRSFPDYGWNDVLMYYPGGEYVNVVGMTAYNTGNYYHGEYWQSFDELYGEIYSEYLFFYGKPLMITEFACSGIGGNKAEWIEDMFIRIKDMPGIKLAVWWNGVDMDGETEARPYYLSENDGSLQAFKKGIHGEY